MYFQDGYRLIRASQILGAISALNTGQITFRALRAYFGCFELLAIREAAERSRIGKKERGRRFLKSELSELMGEERIPSRELTSLKNTGLLSFSEGNISTSEFLEIPENLSSLIGGRGGNRLVPVPRQVLKFLASCSRPSLAKTIIAYLLRGLSLSKSGELKSAGTVKVSWICKLCQLSERAVRGARAELIRLGWITKDTGSFQRKLNRDGAYFVINTAWKRVLKQFAPPARQKRTGSAPPIEKQETLNRSKNQKAARPQRPATRLESGVYGVNGEEESEKPILTDIKLVDLRYFSRLKELYAQAITANWLKHSEANLRNFVAAAARSTRVKGEPVRVFVGIVKRGLWHHLSAEDEGRAVNAINREARQGNFKFTPKDQVKEVKAVKTISEMVHNLLTQLDDRGRREP